MFSGESTTVPKLPFEKHKYDRFYRYTWRVSMQKGLGESYSILFDGKLFKQDEQINALELYPKFMCEKTDNKEKPEA